MRYYKDGKQVEPTKLKITVWVDTCENDIALDTFFDSLGDTLRNDKNLRACGNIIHNVEVLQKMCEVTSCTE